MALETINSLTQLNPSVLAHTHTDVHILPAHGLNGTIPAGLTYKAPFYYYGLQVASDFAFTVPSPGTVELFSMWTNSAQPNTGSLVATVYKNGVITPLSVTFVNADGIAYKQDNNPAHYFTVVAGDYLAVRILNNASSASAQVNGITANLRTVTTTGIP